MIIVVCRPPIFVWEQMTGFNPKLQKALAKRLAAELNFSAAEIQGLSFSEMVWWLTD
ncbi:hypothetical protein SAMN04490187_4288 [Pseudomonas jessenii]|uniref:Uncharacterized protein n=1 Tax=Pseudomonas jessenii TaxID=77298 RepID=A0A1H4SBZ9_PSEJE|nr:hypothetical protein SAMN04490187_4288 [Pseudomonas jessenii]